MTYLKDLIERIGNALGIKSKTPSAAKPASPSKLVPARTPAQHPSEPTTAG